MSAFLGPIHHWLYRKIRLQDELTQALCSAFPADVAEPLLARLNAVFPAETAPLETVIDEGNIHGWLQNQVTLVEARLAAAVTELRKTGPDAAETLRAAAHAFGKQNLISAAAPQEAFQALNDTLLDGMPCDRVNNVLSRGEDAVCWERAVDLHGGHWTRAGGDPADFDVIRGAWIAGMLEGTGLTYRQDGTRFSVERA